MLDPEHMTVDELKKALRDCRNDLCLHCGRYTEAHNGACDGCRWQITAEGSE